MHLQEPGDLGRLDIVVDELSRIRDLVGEAGRDRAAFRAPWPRSGAESPNSSNFAKVVAKPANLPKLRQGRAFFQKTKNLPSRDQIVRKHSNR